MDKCAGQIDKIFANKVESNLEPNPEALKEELKQWRVAQEGTIKYDSGKDGKTQQIAERNEESFKLLAEVGKLPRSAAGAKRGDRSSREH